MELESVLEDKAVDAIVKRVIAGVVNDMLRASLARIINDDFDARHHFADGVVAHLTKEVEKLIDTDPEVKAAVRARLLKNLANDRRF